MKNNATFAFFHIGNESELPRLLISSIRKTNPKSKIIHLTDNNTETLDSVDFTYRFFDNSNKIMLFRSKVYAEYEFNEPTIFLDTDMLVLKKINVDDIFKKNENIFCLRYFDGLINPEYIKKYDLNFIKQGSSWSQIFPFLGCFLAAKNNLIFNKIYQKYLTYDDNLMKWNGDQLALRETFYDNEGKIGLVSESEFAYPYIKDEDFKKVFILHFKGASKKFMQDFFKKNFLENNNKTIFTFNYKL